MTKNRPKWSQNCNCCTKPNLDSSFPVITLLDQSCAECDRTGIELTNSSTGGDQRAHLFTITLVAVSYSIFIFQSYYLHSPLAWPSSISQRFRMRSTRASPLVLTIVLAFITFFTVGLCLLTTGICLLLSIEAALYANQSFDNFRRILICLPLLIFVGCFMPIKLIDTVVRFFLVVN